jgi:hypothetical protein
MISTKGGNRSKERAKEMTEGQEIRATHEEVEEFVGKLRGFNDSLDPAGQAMLGTILDGAVAGESGGYAARVKFADQGGQKPWEDLVGWIEGQGEGETQGFLIKRGF